MALKDWKKGSDLTWYYHGKKSGVNKLYIDNYSGWRVVIVTTYEWDRYERNFKTKSQALKFAKSYMRKH